MPRQRSWCCCAKAWPGPCSENAAQSSGRAKGRQSHAPMRAESRTMIPPSSWAAAISAKGKVMSLSRRRLVSRPSPRRSKPPHSGPKQEGSRPAQPFMSEEHLDARCPGGAAWPPSVVPVAWAGYGPRDPQAADSRYAVGQATGRRCCWVPTRAMVRPRIRELAALAPCVECRAAPAPGRGAALRYRAARLFPAAPAWTCSAVRLPQHSGGRA